MCCSTHAMHSLIIVSTPFTCLCQYTWACAVRWKKKERVYIFDAKTTRLALALNKEIIFFYREVRSLDVTSSL
jgi:hypothetical protein